MPPRTRETALTGKTKSGHILSEQEELFCNQYVFNLGNGKAAAEAAYNVDKTNKNWHNVCAVIARENLTKPHILERIREILDDGGLNDEVVDVETSFLVKQSSDLAAKKGGIDIYNRLKGRYEKDNQQKAISLTLQHYGDHDTSQLRSKKLSDTIIEGTG